MLGTVHNLKADRGFGFIAPDGDSSNEGRHFFHARELLGVTLDYLRVGTRVEFESIRGERGLAAVDVKLAEGK